MKRVITYGTFDLLHRGHLNILKKAKAMGDYLIVGVSSENYDLSHGKLNVSQSLMERIENVRGTGLADEIIVQEYFGQKIHDIKKYGVDVFVVGSDWQGKFDYLNKFCEVVYLERTKGISSTALRNNRDSILRLGIVGNGRIAKRFIAESKYVSGVDVEYVFGRNPGHLQEVCDQFSLKGAFTDYSKFLAEVDAVYIALPHVLHFDYAKKALQSNRHVLCEKPITLSRKETKELYGIASERNLILQEAIKTAYAPCFDNLINVALSGVIGEVKDVDATFTKLIQDKSLREWCSGLGGGSLRELGSYPLLVIAKLLGTEPDRVDFSSVIDGETGVDAMTKVLLHYKNAVATANVGIGVKKEGCCVISGTKGYIYAPAPWWKTEYFEVRFEHQQENQKVFCKFDGDGLRYELATFLKAIHENRPCYQLSERESTFISSVLDDYARKCGDGGVTIIA